MRREIERYRGREAREWGAVKDQTHLRENKGEEVKL